MKKAKRRFRYAKTRLNLLTTDEGWEIIFAALHMALGVEEKLRCKNTRKTTTASNVTDATRVFTARG
jgi:hypothetical protein